MAKACHAGKDSVSHGCREAAQAFLARPLPSAIHAQQSWLYLPQSYQSQSAKHAGKSPATWDLVFLKCPYLLLAVTKKILLSDPNVWRVSVRHSCSTRIRYIRAPLQHARKAQSLMATPC